MTIALAVLGFLTVSTMLALIMTKKTSPLVALITVPLVMGVLSCFFFYTDAETQQIDFWTNFKSLGGFITGSSGIGAVASTGVMFIFSILFFGILTDAGTFQPIIKTILKLVGTDPVKITVGTAVLAMLVHLDGSGAVTFLICIPALLPLYDALKMRRTTLATVVALGAGVMNVLPWGGPTVRAASALGEVNVTDFFMPDIFAEIVGILCVLIAAIMLGRSEKKILKKCAAPVLEESGEQFPEEADRIAYAAPVLSSEEQALLRPKNFIINLILILAGIVCLLFSGFPPAVVFMVFFVLASVINYPGVKESAARVDAHAKSCLMMCSVLFAAGCFTGIMKETGMIKAMAEILVSIIPESAGRALPLIVGCISVPASLLFDPDSFYYGVLPVLSETAARFGVASASIGRAAILGQMTLGFPLSPLTAATFLLVGLSGIDLGEHQKKTLPWAWSISVIMVLAAWLTGGVTI